MSEYEWMLIFRRNLISLLEEHQMTQKELAWEIGVTQATVSRWLSKDSERRTMPCASALINLSYVFDIDLHDLMDFGSRIAR